MTINDFSALIQLSATMSIAFVAVEYVKSYTDILCEKLFKFHDFVQSAFKECREILTDRETLDHLSPVDVDGKSTNTVIEKAKRKNESLTKEINEVEKTKKEEVSKACQARSMSSICLFIFLFNVLLLFLGGIETSYKLFSHTSSMILCSLAILYIVLGWIIGETDTPKKFCDFSSLRHISISFLIIFLFSIIPTFWIIQNSHWVAFIQSSWNYFLFSGVVCSYLNFIIFIIKIGRKAFVFKKDVNKSKEELKNKCIEAKKDEDDLIATTRVKAKLKTD